MATLKSLICQVLCLERKILLAYTAQGHLLERLQLEKREDVRF